MSLKILGAGMAHPGFVLSNSALSEIVETDDQWITTRTGIKSRFISTNESLLDIAMTAAKLQCKFRMKPETSILSSAPRFRATIPAPAFHVRSSTSWALHVLPLMSTLPVRDYICLRHRKILF